MPALDNQRHERFAQELAKGKSADEAYAAAGYKPNRGNATTLKANQSILARVAELQNKAAMRTEVTLASLLAEAELARAAAMEAGQISAAVAAIKEKGVLAGVRVEKRENTNKNTLNQMSEAEIDRLIAESVAGEKAASGRSTLTH